MDQLWLDVRHELPGWTLFWADLDLAPGSEAALAPLRSEVAARARASHTLEGLGSHPTAAAVRKLFRQAGCDPTRHRPSSEALLRRVLKGEELPAIHPLVDLNNCLSVELVVPACVMAFGSVTPPFVLRAGREGEAMLSMRGPYELHGKPLLVDGEGPFGTPITDSERVRVGERTSRAWLVAYLPTGVVDAACAREVLDRLLEDAPVAHVIATAVTPPIG
ncbi:MAG TPA: phenylalanine--tRNA ligase beta subunit-related protein [Thermoanaerobaculaceae bacterium]|nr:phenylalanine--tRNA ligase beta subunit-related protein [Thermoanaerobaculaceae bacterium]